MSGLSDLGKLIALAGAALLILGGLLWLVGKVSFPEGGLGLLGRLPGDIHIQRGNLSCFFPLTTMLLLSVLLTVILNIILRLMRK